MIKQIFLPCMLLFLSASLFGGDRGEDILKASDLYRNRWTSFVLRVRLTSYEHGDQKKESNLEVMMKGEDRSLVRFLDKDQKGQYLLMLEDMMWLYLPNTRRPIRVMPLQRLMGDASNGDVARTNFSRDYHAVLIGEEVVDGKDCVKLELTATNESATYHRVEYWVTKNGFIPVKAEIFLASGKHYKSVTYDHYEIIHGQRTLTQLTLYDRLRKNRHTVMQFLNYEPKELPEKYFNKNYLTKLK